ncbi:hypothetical protein E2C01_035372 [Portunus trituberculatus]|uniref:Uncharacterized protein n=1 Tax=Portunus trituberculatus TaxID=210409 RepID=A0A5B7F954_PORTR|nr:hypothetical protein [Portunus trituberculatus]
MTGRRPAEEHKESKHPPPPLFQQLIQSADKRVMSHTIAGFTELISFRDPHVMSSRLMVEKPERDVERVIDASLAEVIAGHLR